MAPRRRYAAQRLALAGATCIALAACGPDQAQFELCRKAIGAFVGSDQRVTVVATQQAGSQARDIAIDFTLAGRTALPRERRIVCRFAGGRFDADRLELTAVVIDDRPPLSEIQLLFLKRWLSGAVEPIDAPPVETPPAESTGLGPEFRWHPIYLLQQLLNGAIVGSVYALIAIGYTLVYGVTRIINFAYGEIYMIGAFLAVIAFTALGHFGVPPALALVPGVAVVCAAFACLHGIAAERIVFRPLANGGRLIPLIAAIGLAMVLQNLVRFAQSARSRWLAPLDQGAFELASEGGFKVLVTTTQAMIVALALAAALAVTWVMARSSVGRALRAAADDPEMSALLGLDPRRAVVIAFALGAALAAISGVIAAVHYGYVDFFIGYLIGFKALTAAILGGIGSVPGAALGGLLIGMIEALWAGYFSIAAKDIVIFIVLVAVLIFRPEGLLGVRVEGQRWGRRAGEEEG